MIDLEFLKSLIQAIDESSIDSIEIERAGTRVRVSKTPTGVVAQPVAATAPAPAPAAAAPAAPPVADAAPAATDPAPAATNLVDVYSPMVGTFYRSPAPDAPPFVDVGASVGQGDALCIIEAMKLMNELESEVDGVIREICVADAEPVEYGQLLFRVEPA